MIDLRLFLTTPQVLKETLRLYPTAPGTSRDVMEDFVINGIPIPGGVTCFVSFFSMNSCSCKAVCLQRKVYWSYCTWVTTAGHRPLSDGFTWNVTDLNTVYIERCQLDFPEIHSSVPIRPGEWKHFSRIHWRLIRTDSTQMLPSKPLAMTICT